MSEISAAQLLSQLRSMAEAAGGGAPLPDDAGSTLDFSDLLSQAVERVNESQQRSSELKKAFQLGDESVDVTQVMIAAQKAGIEFQLMMQVRNKLVNAYKDIMNMQI